MKTSLTYIVCICAFMFGTTSINAQRSITEPATVKKTTTLKIDKSNIKVQRHTVMSRFEPEIASSAEERLKKKQNRITETERKLSILDTLDISERKRKMLLHDLKYNPFSNRLTKATLVETEFQDATEN